MKKVILTAVMVSGLCFANYAQNNAPATGDQAKEQRTKLTPAQRSEKDASWAADKLTLSADQKSKWQAASLERSNANEALRNKMSGSTTPDERKQLHMQMKANENKFDATVSSLLTDEQKTKYDAAKKERHGMHGHGMKHGGQPQSDK